MRGAEKLFDAITEVREDLVEEALDYRFQAKKAVPWQRYAKWAACLALVVCIGYLAANLDLRMGGMNSAAGNSGSNSAAGETTGDTADDAGDSDLTTGAGAPEDSDGSAAPGDGGESEAAGAAWCRPSPWRRRTAASRRSEHWRWSFTRTAPRSPQTTIL